MNMVKKNINNNIITITSSYIGWLFISDDDVVVDVLLNQILT